MKTLIGMSNLFLYAIGYFIGRLSFPIHNGFMEGFEYLTEENIRRVNRLIEEELAEQAEADERVANKAKSSQ